MTRWLVNLYWRVRCSFRRDPIARMFRDPNDPRIEYIRSMRGTPEIYLGAPACPPDCLACEIEREYPPATAEEIMAARAKAPE